jgi:hypothetical protein
MFNRMIDPRPISCILFQKALSDILWTMPILGVPRFGTENAR